MGERSTDDDEEAPGYGERNAEGARAPLPAFVRDRAIENGARERDVQLLLGHSSPDMVRRYSSTYNAEQAARRHGEFSPARLLAEPPAPIAARVS